MVRGVTYRGVTSPTERIIAGLTVGAVHALISVRAIDAITGLGVTEVARATDHAITGVKRAVTQRDGRVNWVADGRVSCPTHGLVTGLAVGAVDTLISVGAVYRWRTVRLRERVVRREALWIITLPT